MLTSEKDLVQLITEDDEMMAILHTVKILNLPDWWICAGFVRSKIWDTLHGFETRTPLPDVDVIYFDKLNTDEQNEKKLEKHLKSLLSHVPWSVKNEVRMMTVNQIPPYSSSVDAISKFPETASSLGVKLDAQEQVILTAPWGIHDAIQLIIKPTPFFMESNERMILYKERLAKKNWQAIWPHVTFYPVY